MFRRMRRPGKRALFAARELHRSLSEGCAIETGCDRVARAWEGLRTLAPKWFPDPIVVWLGAPIAFTAPDGRIYVSRELLSHGLSDDGVAFVLAHELAHHRLGHFERLYRGDERLEDFTIAAWLAHLASRPTSEEDELAADALAADLCVASDIAPRAGFELFRLLRRFAFENASDHVRATYRTSAPTLLFDAHPPHDVRERALCRHLAQKRDPRTDHAAWTHAMRACSRCRLRLPAFDACPICGEPTLALIDTNVRADLRADVRHANHALARRSVWSAVAIALALPPTIAFAVNVACGDTVKESLSLAALFAFVEVVLWPLFSGAAQFALDTVEGPPSPLRIYAHAPAVEPSVVFRGIARATGPLLAAPFSMRACIGYRVRDRRGRIVDDGAIVSFVLDDGERRIAIGSDAVVALSLACERQENAPPRYFERWLTNRLVPSAIARRARFEEAVLRDGDLIEVRCTPHALRDGELRGTVEHPLLVRAP
jgi:hypothetical protein